MLFARGIAISCSPSTMGFKCIFALYVALICVNCQDTSEERKCFHIYECCQKVDNDCIEYCEPIYVCKNNEPNQDQGLDDLNLGLNDPAGEILESSTYQTAIVIDFIGVSTCLKGFRLDPKGRCKRKF